MKVVFCRFGAKKSRGRIAQICFEWLGSICSREGMEACEHHLKAVREWGEISDISGMRRFLGNFNWVRQHFPHEFVLALPALTAQVKKSACWPMPQAAEDSKKYLH